MDAINFEPNLFRDSDRAQSPAPPTSSSSSSSVPHPSSSSSGAVRVVGSPRLHAPPARLTENAKIFALLLASKASAAPRSPSKAVQKVTFESPPREGAGAVPVPVPVPVPGAGSSSSSAGPDVDPVLPAHHQHQAQQRPDAGSARPLVRSAAASSRQSGSPTGLTSFLMRKRPRLLDTADSSGVSGVSVSGQGPSNKFAYRTTPLTCSTPLSRFIEMYEHDENSGSDEADDNGGEIGHDELELASHFSTSPTTASMLRLLQTRSPKLANNSNFKHDQDKVEGPVQSRQFFTFDTTHTDRPSVAALVLKTPSNITQASFGPASVGPESDLDSFLQCFPLTPLAPSPSCEQRQRLLQDHITPSLSAGNNEASNNLADSEYDGKCNEHDKTNRSNRPAISVRQDFEDEKMDTYGSSSIPLQAMLQPLQAKLDDVLHPTKSGTDSSTVTAANGPSTSTTISSLATSSSALPPLPSFSTTCFAPPASLDALLKSSSSKPEKKNLHQATSQQTMTVPTALTPNLQDDKRISTLRNIEVSNRVETKVIDDEMSEYVDNDSEGPSLESLCRWLCEKYCPAVPSELNKPEIALIVHVSHIAATVGCSQAKINRIFYVLDVCNLVRQTEVNPPTYLWLARSRVDLMQLLESVFSQLQTEVLTEVRDNTKDDFLQGVAALHKSFDAEAKIGNVHCLPKNRKKLTSLSWVERTVIGRILLRKYLADVLVGHTSHCHPAKAVSQEDLNHLSSETRLSTLNLRQRLNDITSVLSGLEVLQKIPLLNYLAKYGKSAIATSSECADVDLKSTFRWIFPLDYLCIFYRREQRNTQNSMGRGEVKNASQGKILKSRTSSAMQHSSVSMYRDSDTSTSPIVTSLLKKQNSSKTNKGGRKLV